MNDLGWRCSWQDYRHWRTADLREAYPPIETRDFPTEEAARREAGMLRLAGFTVCVAPVPPPRRTARGRQTRVDDPGPRFNKDWKLAR